MNDTYPGGNYDEVPPTQDQPAVEQLGETVMAQIDQADAEQGQPDGSLERPAEPDVANRNRDEVISQWSERDDRPDEQTAETIAHATNKLETYLRNEVGRGSKDQIEFVKANLQRQVDFIEANPERTEAMYLQTKAELFDRLQQTISDKMSWYSRDGNTTSAVPNFELNNILRDFDQTGVDIAFGAAISRAASEEQESEAKAA